ncbi:MAG: putative metallopeptidase, partial [Bacillota bacterium]
MPQYQPAQAWEDLARAVAEARPEVMLAAPGSIIFVENIDGGGDTMAKLRRLSPLFQHLLHKDFVLEIFRVNTENLSNEQRALLVYDQLRHINMDGKLDPHDVQEWAEVAAAVPDWRTTKRQLPNILAPTFDWERFRGPQMTIGEVIEQAEEEGATVSIEVPSAAQAA